MIEPVTTSPCPATTVQPTAGNQPPAAAPQANQAPAAPELSLAEKEIQAMVAEAGGAEKAKAALAEIKANAEKERTGLIANIRAVESCAFSEDELKALSTCQLKKLAESLKPADYSGRGGPRANQTAELVEAPMPQ